MKVNGEDYRAVWLDAQQLKLIDQTQLPHKFLIKTCNNYEETAQAIEQLNVRGASTISATAAFGMAQATLTIKGISKESFWNRLEEAKKRIEQTRPTSMGIQKSTDRVFKKLEEGLTIGEWKELATDEAQAISEEFVLECMRIGEFGSELIKKGSKILTHSNAGALSTVDWGTALAPMRIAAHDKKKFFVVINETRPRCQGSRLTSWELLGERIPHAIIADNATGFYMKNNKIDFCLVGANIISAKGDLINDIGTYEKAVLAKENNIPFYVATPSSVINKEIKKAEDIQIEERPENEVLSMWGKTGEEIKEIRIAPEKARALNPAFDITPSKYITGFITEKGIVKPSKLKKL